MARLNEATLAFSAQIGVLPELVFESMTDPDLVARWLPTPFVLDEHGSGVLRVRLGTHSGSVDGAQQHIEAQAFLPLARNDEADCHGYAEIMIVPEGAGSRLDVTVFPQDCTKEQIHEAFEAADTALRDTIDERMTAG